MNTLKEILGSDELLREFPHLGSMNIKLFLSICAYMKQEAVNIFGKEKLLRILQLANRQCPQFYHEFYLNMAKDAEFYKNFFSRDMSLIAAQDFEKKGKNIIEEAMESLQEKETYAGSMSRYQPDSHPGYSPIDYPDEGTPETVTYREDYIIEELKILVNSGSFPLCTIPVYSSWGNDYTHHSGEVPDPLGEGDRIAGYLIIKITGFDNESEKFIFTPVHVEEKEDYCFEGWAEDSITGQPGYGTLSCYYIENYIHPLFYTYDIKKTEFKKPKKHGAVNILNKLISTDNPGKKMLVLVGAAAVLVVLLYLVTPKKPDRATVVDRTQEVQETGKKQVEADDKEIKPGEIKDSVEETEPIPEELKQEKPKEEKLKAGETPEEQPTEQPTEKKEEPPEERESVKEDGKEKPIATKIPVLQSKSKKQKPGFYYTSGDFLYIQVYPGHKVSQLERALFLKRRELYKYNPANKLRRLKAYTWLKVPLNRIRPFVIYKLKPGDTITSLSERFHTTRYTIMVLNHVWSDRAIKPGNLALILKHAARAPY